MEMEERNRLETLYRPAVNEIVEQWAVGKPPNPSPVATSNKPSGYFRLTDWLLEYLVAKNEFPKGIHQMPQGIDRLGNIEPSFPVDFDPLTEGRALPLL